jgi:hypothetical protein
MEQNPFWEANGHSANQKISEFYEIWKFITVLTIARHWSLSWARCIQSTILHPQFPKNHSNIIFIFVPSSSEWSLLFRFQTKMLCACLISSTCATCSAHYTVLDLITSIIFNEAYSYKFTASCHFLPLRPKHCPQHPPHIPSIHVLPSCTFLNWTTRYEGVLGSGGIAPRILWPRQ